MIDANGFGLIQDIDVRLTVELGRAQMRLRDVLELGEDSVVMLDRLIDEPLDVMVNGKLIAKGEVIAEGNRFGLRILELAGNGRGDAAADRRAPPIEVTAAGHAADKGAKAGKAA
jgi:flagellar motor switch protein FliN/FliY